MIPEHKGQDQSSSRTIETIIEEFVDASVAPIKDIDPDTAELHEEIMTDYLKHWSTSLRWIKDQNNPRRVLYPGSGFDLFPKLIFGERNTFHTSLDQYRNGDSRYYQELNSKYRIIADNKALPFSNECFDTTVLSGVDLPTIELWLPEITRVLIQNGSLLIGKSIYENELDEEMLHNVASKLNYQKEVFPDSLQSIGSSEAYFFYYKKRNIQDGQIF